MTEHRDAVTSHHRHLESTTRPRRTLAAVSVATAVAAVIAGSAAGTVSAAPSVECAPVMVLGIPGSNEGAAHHPNGTTQDQLYGGTVAEALAGARDDAESQVVAAAVEYPAVLSLNFSDGEYFASKDAGYAAAYKLLQTWAVACPSARFSLIGYSQGAHVAGDLTQTILHRHSPITPDRLAGTLLLADPGFVGYGARTQPLQYESTSNTFTPVGSRRIGLSPRTDFDEDDPVYSVCFVGDVVCAPGKSVELHQRYATAVYDGTGESVAYTYGRLMAAEENW